MRPFVDDMEDAASGRLAAVHFKNRYIQRSHCYVCHTDYGLFGTMDAKLAGVGHIWKESTGSYTLPVRIARPYRFTICLDCHAQSAKFARVPEHSGIVAATAGGRSTCSSCHGTSHRPREQRGVQP
jgi:nitrate/TMAO reductase-like tetraheme cytochrome c subunit